MNSFEKQMEAVMRLCVAENERERSSIREEIRGYLAHGQWEKLTPEQEIRRILLELGAPDHLAGHPYVIRAIQLVVEDRLYINSITFGLYPQLAAEFDTTPARVERAIRHLIEVTWSRGDLEILDKYFGNTISASRGKPTNSEFIALIADKLQLQLKSSEVANF